MVNYVLHDDHGKKDILHYFYISANGGTDDATDVPCGLLDSGVSAGAAPKVSCEPPEDDVVARWSCWSRSAFTSGGLITWKRLYLCTWCDVCHLQTLESKVLNVCSIWVWRASASAAASVAALPSAAAAAFSTLGTLCVRLVHDSLEPGCPFTTQTS